MQQRFITDKQNKTKFFKNILIKTTASLKGRRKTTLRQQQQPNDKLFPFFKIMKYLIFLQRNKTKTVGNQNITEVKVNKTKNIFYKKNTTKNNKKNI